MNTNPNEWNDGAQPPAHESPVLALADLSKLGIPDAGRKRACVIARWDKAGNQWRLVDAPLQRPLNNPTGVLIKSWRENLTPTSPT